MDTNNDTPARRMRHGDRPTEALVFDEPAATSGDATDLQQLKALALAYVYENGDHWYSLHEIADGITYEPAANFILGVSPAVVLDLIARIEQQNMKLGAAASLLGDKYETQSIERTAAPAPSAPFAWMKPNEITGLIEASGKDGEARHYGRIYARQYDADMVPVCAAHPANASGDELPPLSDAEYQAILGPVLSREGMRRYRNADPLNLDPSDLRAMIDRARAAVSAAKVQSASGDELPLYHGRDDDLLSLAQVQALSESIKPGDGWGGEDWDFALANAAAAFVERKYRVAAPRGVCEACNGAGWANAGCVDPCAQCNGQGCARAAVSAAKVQSASGDELPEDVLRDAARYRWIMDHPENVEWGDFYDRSWLGPQATVSDAIDHFMAGRPPLASAVQKVASAAVSAATKPTPDESLMHQALRRMLREYIATRARIDGKRHDADMSEYEDINVVREARKAMAATKPTADLSTKLPKWIDDLKGYDSTMDAMIEYIIELQSLLATKPAGEPFGYFHELLDHEGKGKGVWLGCPSKHATERAYTEGETGKEIVALYRAPTAAPADQVRDTLEQQLIERRIGLTPEHEGGFHAYVYGDLESAVLKGYGVTPTEAVADALKSAAPEGAEGEQA